MDINSEKLYLQLEKQGLKGRVVPVQHIIDLKTKLEEQFITGLLAEELYHERLLIFRFHPPEVSFQPKSLIVIAMPRPQTPVNFSWDGIKLSLILPPTYSQYDEITRYMGMMLAKILEPDGFHVAPALLPLKLLAACSGLVVYGKNNIGYIAGWGSFFQLAAFYSDLPCDDDTWQEPQMMERCKTCQACLIKCPTGAISNDRFLLYAERCLTFHNERPSTCAFPGWIDKGAHNSLMGCMICQRFCPANKPFLEWYEESQDFSRDETSLIIQGATLDQLPSQTVKKLNHLELAGDLDKLPRNLQVLIEGRAPSE